jgi:hypothetical protein
MALSKDERAEVILMCRGRSQREGAETFDIRHPERPPITRACVGKLLAKFKETGSVSANQAAELHDADNDSSQCLEGLHSTQRSICVGWMRKLGCHIQYSPHIKEKLVFLTNCKRLRYLVKMILTDA